MEEMEEVIMACIACRVSAERACWEGTAGGAVPGDGGATGERPGLAEGEAADARGFVGGRVPNGDCWMGVALGEVAIQASCDTVGPDGKLS